jgi:hypothetical protein
VNFCGQRHLLFRLYASLYRVDNFPSSFCTGFNIAQRLPNVYDAIRHYHCPLPIFTVRSVLFNKHTLDFAKKLMCFVTSNMFVFYTPTILMLALRRQQIHGASCDHVPAP